MKKCISLLLIFSMALSSAVTSFAASCNDIIVVDGNSYTVERVVTDTYSQAILRETSTNTIVENFTYYFEKNLLVNNSTNQMVFSTSKFTENSMRPTSNDDSKYKYSHTERFDFSIFEYTTIGLAAAIMALNPGVGTAVITSIVSAAIGKAFDSIYVVQECYAYEEKEGREYYHYSKRITTIHGNDGSLLGGPWTTYQKIHMK